MKKKTDKLDKFEELTLTFRTKFLINKESYPVGWKRKQILEAEIENFYNSPKDYIELLIDEDDYTIEIS